MARVLTVTLNPAWDKVIRGRKAQLFPGGKGVNVARALKALGIAVTPFVAVAGVQGRALVKGLKSEGFCPRVFSIPGETRINVTSVRTGREPVRVFGSGPVWTKSDVVRLKGVLRRLISPKDLVVFSGSLPRGVPIDLYGDLIGIAKRRSAIVFFDTHGMALKEALRSQPYVVKPNRQEAEEFLGIPIRSRRDIKKALQSFARRGMKRVLLTIGSQGLAVREGREFLFVKGPRFAGHGVGCGDAALAGYIAGVLRKEPFLGQLCLAASCGGAAAMTDRPGGINLQDVEKIKRCVKITRF